MAMAENTGKFVWFEHVSRDPAQAQRFYGELFGWKVEAFSGAGPGEYEMIKAGDRTIGGFQKLEAKDTRPPHWISYLAVPDVDAGVAAAKAAGAKVVAPAFDVPTVGRMAGILDPQGAALMLFRGSGEGPPSDTPKVHEFCWNELWARDAAAAVAFYTKVFGYTARDMDMGPEGKYHILETGGVGRGGVMNAPVGVPAMWLPYVAVEDCDKLAARAKRLAAKVHVEPTDIPNIGRFTVLEDPQGATIAAIQMAAK
jgi:uncharacterized protein